MMADSAPRSLKRAYVLNAAQTALNILYPIATFAYVARTLKPASFGKVSLAISLATFFLVLAAMALPLYGPKAIAKARNDRDRLGRTFTGLFLIGAIASLAWTGAYLLLLPLSGSFQADWALFVTAGSCLVWNIFSVDWVYSGLEDFQSILLRNTLIKFASLLALPLLVRTEGDFLWFAAINAASAGVYNLWGFLAVGRHVGFRFKDAEIVPHLRPLMWLFISSIAASVYLQLDSVILGSLTDDRTVGLYSNAMRVVRVSTVFLASLSMSMVPRISLYVEKSMEDASTAVIEKSMRLLFFIAFPMTAFFVGLSPEITRIASGPEFTEAAAALRLASPILLLAAFTNLVGFQILVPKGGEASLLLAMVLAASTSLLLDFLLIPYLGMTGCVIAAVSAEAVAAAALVFQARKSLARLKILGRPVYLYSSLSLFLGTAVWFLAGRIGNPWLAMATASGVMAVGYLGILRIAGDEVALELHRLAVRLAPGRRAPGLAVTPDSDRR